MARIEDYALIGNCQTAALVSKDASIDWLCLPRFDSGAVFAAILGNASHGRWSITPAAEKKETTRRYLPGTLVLETTFTTREGRASVIDLMPIRRGEPSIVRLVVGHEGRMRMGMELVMRFDYGSIVPWVRRANHGIRAIAGPDSVLVHTPVPLVGRDMTTVAEFTVGAGDRIPFALCWHPSYLREPAPLDPEKELTRTEAWWRAWSEKCTYHGPWREVVVRSLITLKALTYAPTGGIVGAPTTSLPEKLGGSRNWDYRYCWLRDATFTLYALLQAGYLEEARSWRDWLLRAAAGDPSKLQTMYAVDGARRLDELELPWLPGHAGSRPVRIGNEASTQLQLDVYGEIADVMHQCYRANLESDAHGWMVQRALLSYLETGWREPDEGIWEVRGKRRHFTHSKVMSWVAIDRAIKSAHLMGLNAPIERWRALRREIHDEVCARAWDADLGSFVQAYGEKRLDASLLLMPIVGFLPIGDPRVRATIAAIEKQLTYDGLVRRYLPDETVDGQPDDEGVFLPCSFWLCDDMRLAGRHDEARALFERLLSLANDVGLLAEEYDPVSRRLLGNFPQAFSHVAVVNTVMNIAQEQGPARHRGQT